MCTRKGTGGSNPSLSANFLFQHPRSESQPPRAFMLPRTQDRIFLLSVLVVVAGVLSLYGLLAGQSPVYGDLTRDYTQRLATGHADLSLQPDPRLLALADPYDPKANAGISALDTSLYGGHYYVYFGITPFVTLLVP